MRLFSPMIVVQRLVGCGESAGVGLEGGDPVVEVGDGAHDGHGGVRASCRYRLSALRGEELAGLCKMVSDNGDVGGLLVPVRQRHIAAVVVYGLDVVLLALMEYDRHLKVRQRVRRICGRDLLVVRQGLLEIADALRGQRRLHIA